MHTRITKVLRTQRTWSKDCQAGRQPSKKRWTDKERRDRYGGEKERGEIGQEGHTLKWVQH